MPGRPNIRFEVYRVVDGEAVEWGFNSLAAAARRAGYLNEACGAYNSEPYKVRPSQDSKTGEGEKIRPGGD